MISPADILSAQAAASLQRDSLKYDLVGSPSKRDDMGTVYPAYLMPVQRLQHIGRWQCVKFSKKLIAFSE